MKTKRNTVPKRSETSPAKHNKLKSRFLIFILLSGSICGSCNPDDDTDGTSGATSSSLIAPQTQRISIHVTTTPSSVNYTATREKFLKTTTPFQGYEQSSPYFQVFIN